MSPRDDAAAAPKWEQRGARCFTGWITATTTILAQDYLGAWWAFAYMCSLFVAWLTFEVYAAGVRRGNGTP